MLRTIILSVVLFPAMAFAQAEREPIDIFGRVKEPIEKPERPDPEDTGPKQKPDKPSKPKPTKPKKPVSKPKVTAKDTPIIKIKNLENLSYQSQVVLEKYLISLLLHLSKGDLDGGGDLANLASYYNTLAEHAIPEFDFDGDSEIEITQGDLEKLTASIRTLAPYTKQALYNEATRARIMSVTNRDNALIPLWNAIIIGSGTK